VQRGQVLPEVGDSHDAREPHLHLEVNPVVNRMDDLSPVLGENHVQCDDE
jgi:hypothetical protein